MGPEPCARRPDRTQGPRSPPGADATVRSTVNEAQSPARCAELQGGWVLWFRSYSRRGSRAQRRQTVGKGRARSNGENCFERHADAAKQAARFARAPGMNEELGHSRRSPAPRIKWIMTATYSICRDKCERPGAGVQPRSLAATVAAWVPGRLPANGRTRSRQGPIPATEIGATTRRASRTGPVHDRRSAGRLGAKDPITWTKATRCSSTPRTRKRPGWWCCATAG